MATRNDKSYFLKKGYKTILNEMKGDSRGANDIRGCTIM